MASEMTCVNEASRSSCCKLLQVSVKLILTESSDSVYLGWLFGALVDKSILDFDNYDVGVKQLFQLAFMPNNNLLPIPLPTFLCKSPKIKYTRLSTWSIWCELLRFGYIICRYACFLFNYNISAPKSIKLRSNVKLLTEKSETLLRHDQFQVQTVFFALN